MSCEKEYNKFIAVNNATKNIINYLIENNEDLWKLLYYIENSILPLSQDNLTFEQKVSMICTNPYDINNNVEKNILFEITAVDEAFSTAIPQIRIDVGDIIPLDRTRGYMEIAFQIIVPNKQDLFTTESNNVARRSLVIYTELAKTLNGTYIENCNFNSPLFLDRSSIAGKKTGSYPEQYNRHYTGRYVVFSVLI